MLEPVENSYPEPSVWYVQRTRTYMYSLCIYIPAYADALYKCACTCTHMYIHCACTCIDQNKENWGGVCCYCSRAADVEGVSEEAGVFEQTCQSSTGHGTQLGNGVLVTAGVPVWREGGRDTSLYIMHVYTCTCTYIYRYSYVYIPSVSVHVHIAILILLTSVPVHVLYIYVHVTTYVRTYLYVWHTLTCTGRCSQPAGFLGNPQPEPAGWGRRGGPMAECLPRTHPPPDTHRAWPSASSPWLQSLSGSRTRG